MRRMTPPAKKVVKRVGSRTSGAAAPVAASRPVVSAEVAKINKGVLAVKNKFFKPR